MVVPELSSVFVHANCVAKFVSGQSALCASQPQAYYPAVAVLAVLVLNVAEVIIAVTPVAAS